MKDYKRKFDLKMLINRIKSQSGEHEFITRFQVGFLHSFYVFTPWLTKDDFYYLQDKYINHLPAVRVRPCAGKVGV